MLEYKLVWSKRALTDLQNVHNFLANESIDAASKVVGSILDRTDQLLMFPKSGSTEPRLAHRKYNYRILVCGNYKVIYRINDRQIIVVSIFDTRKNPAKMLK